MNQNATSYTKTAIILHWLIAFFIFGMFALGWFMTELPKNAPKELAHDLFNLGIYSWQSVEAISPRNFYFNLHKSLGITIMELIAFRIFWRITHRPPAMLTSYKTWEVKLANGTHHLLYTLMTAVPLTGLIMAIYGKYGVKWFGIEIISGADNKPLRDIFESAHELIGIFLLVIIGLHIAGALKHKLIDKDGTLKRMSLH
jgi:cytochrome b561